MRNRTKIVEAAWNLLSVKNELFNKYNVTEDETQS